METKKIEEKNEWEKKRNKTEKNQTESVPFALRLISA